MVFLSVVLTLGFRRSSRASDWYNLAVAVPGLVKTPITITTTPNPPTHCSNALKNNMLWGNISTLSNIVIPVPVNAEVLSKIPFKKSVPVASEITTPPTIPAHIQAIDEIIIPCFSFILLLEYLSRVFIHMYPKITEKTPGIIKQL